MLPAELAENLSEFRGGCVVYTKKSDGGALSGRSFDASAGSARRECFSNCQVVEDSVK